MLQYSQKKEVLDLTVITFLDEKNGMMFNNRRQSKDEVVKKYIKEIIGEETLYLSAYSKKYYDFGKEVNKFNNSMSFALVEDPKNMPLSIDKFIIFYWNRHYPADSFFNCDLNKYVVTNETEIVGKSHEKITVRTYERGNV